METNDVLAGPVAVASANEGAFGSAMETQQTAHESPDKTAQEEADNPMSEYEDAFGSLELPITYPSPKIGPQDPSHSGAFPDLPTVCTPPSLSSSPQVAPRRR